jgi:hypothetical protein
MTTKDFVADFGGVGDGQRTTVIGSVSGSTFTPVSNIFASRGGDPTGKCAYLNATGYQFPDQAVGGVLTITGYNSSTGAITFDRTTPATVTSVSIDILWGTDNFDAFMGALGWNAYGRTQGATLTTLTVTGGVYCIGDKGTFSPNEGIQNSLWTGPSGAASTCTIAPLFPYEFQLGGGVPVYARGGLTDPLANSARLNTANIGDTTVTLTDAATYGSRIVVDRDCIIASGDTQSTQFGGYGYPPNPYFYDHNIIAGYGTGTVTLQTPLANVHKSTFPLWDDGRFGGVDQGGPATIYVVEADYPKSIEIRDIRVDSPYDQISVHGRDVVLRNIICTGRGIYPSQNRTWRAYNCVFPGNIEIDKIVGLAEFIDCTIHILGFQSGSPDVCNVVRGTCDGLFGSPKELNCTDVAFTNGATVHLGALAYGYTKKCTFTGCTGIDIFEQGGASVSLSAMPSASMTGGVIKFLKSDSNLTGENLARVLTPGGWITFDRKYIDQVVDVYEDGTYFYARLRYATGGFPFAVGVVTTHPCPDFTMRGCSGASLAVADLNGAPARLPLFSYSRRTYDGSIAHPFPANSGSADGPIIIGTLVSLTLDVPALRNYTGSNGNLRFRPGYQFGFGVLNPDFSSTTYDADIKLNTVGTRIITPTGVTGAQSGDAGLDPLGAIRLYGDTFPFMSADIRGESSSVFPAFTVEWITDQGIPPTSTAQLRVGRRA